MNLSYAKIILFCTMFRIYLAQTIFFYKKVYVYVLKLWHNTIEFFNNKYLLKEVIQEKQKWMCIKMLFLKMKQVKISLSSVGSNLIYLSKWIKLKN